MSTPEVTRWVSVTGPGGGYAKVRATHAVSVAHHGPDKPPTYSAWRFTGPKEGQSKKLSERAFKTEAEALLACEKDAKEIRRTAVESKPLPGTWGIAQQMQEKP